MNRNYDTRGHRMYEAALARQAAADMQHYAGQLNDRLNEAEHEQFWATVPDNAHPATIARMCREKLAELDAMPRRRNPGAGLRRALEAMTPEQVAELNSHMNED